jgi:hypothetical protein
VIDQDKPVSRATLGLYVQEGANIFGENKVLRIAMIAMVMWSAFNSIMLQKALDARTVVLISPDGEVMFELTNTSAGDKYLYRMARYTTFLVGNMTAANARDQLKEVLMMIHPTSYGAFVGHFNTLAKEVERYPNISYVIEINGNKAISIEGNTLLIDASRKRLVGDTVTRKTRLTYEIAFVIEGGRFWIMDIKEISPSGGHLDEQ